MSVSTFLLPFDFCLLPFALYLSVAASYLPNASPFPFVQEVPDRGLVLGPSTRPELRNVLAGFEERQTLLTGERLQLGHHAQQIVAAEADATLQDCAIRADQENRRHMRQAIGVRGGR